MTPFLPPATGRNIATPLALPVYFLSLSSPLSLFIRLLLFVPGLPGTNLAGAMFAKISTTQA
jgi:hypothetical protein